MGFFTTEEDRKRWEEIKRRDENKRAAMKAERLGSVKQGIQRAAQTATQYLGQDVQATLSAERRAETDRRDESRGRVEVISKRTVFDDSPEYAKLAKNSGPEY